MQSGHSAAGSRTRRRDTDAEHSRYFLEAETLVVMQQQRLRLIRGQMRETLTNFVLRAEPVGIRRGGKSVQIAARFVDPRKPAGRAPIHQKHVARQAEYPGPHRKSRIVSGSRPVHPEKCFLKEIVDDLRTVRQM